MIDRRQRSYILSCVDHINIDLRKSSATDNPVVDQFVHCCGGELRHKLSDRFAEKMFRT